MIEKDKKTCKALNYFEHFLVFISAVIFALLFGVSAGIL